jgi:hypothetical protein
MFAREQPTSNVGDWLDDRLEEFKAMLPEQPVAPPPAPAVPPKKEPQPPAPSTDSGPPAQAHSYLGDDPWSLSPEALASLPDDKLDEMVRNDSLRSGRMVNPDKVRHQQLRQKAT